MRATVIEGRPPTAGPISGVLVAATIVGTGQNYTMIPLLNAVAIDLSASTSGVTWMASAFGLGLACGLLLAGPAVDRCGPRRVMLVGLGACALATAAVATSGSVGVGVALRAVQGLAASALGPAGFAYLMRHIAPPRRPLVITAVTGAGLGAAIVMQVAAQLMGRMGWRWVFVVFAVALCGLGLVARRVLRPDADPDARSVVAALAAVPRLLGQPRLLAVCGAAICLLGGLVLLYTALELNRPDYLTSAGDGLLALRACALPAVVIAPLCTPMVCRIPPHVRVVAVSTVAGAAALVAGQAAGPALLAGGLIVFVFGIALAMPTLVELVGRSLVGSSDASAVGTAIGLYASALFLGSSMGSHLAGALTDSSFPCIAGLAAAVLVTGGVLAAFGAGPRGPDRNAARPSPTAR